MQALKLPLCGVIDGKNRSLLALMRFQCLLMVMKQCSDLIHW